MGIASRILSGSRIWDLRNLSLSVGSCPFCGPTVFVRLNLEEGGIRCCRCAASTVHLSLGAALHHFVADLSVLDVCELSARGPLASYLSGACRTFSGSEYFENVPSGAILDGIRCEDAQHLSYPDGSFDLVLHTEVMEHVTNDAEAFAELHRVLRPDGLMLFTVPLTGLDYTVERARREDNGTIQHLLEPSYHLDPSRNGAGVLAYRDYGSDIVERVARAGFVDVAIITPPHRIPWLKMRHVVTARRAHR